MKQGLKEEEDVSSEKRVEKKEEPKPKAAEKKDTTVDVPFISEVSIKLLLCENLVFAAVILRYSRLT
jgi:hypothetical protein